MASFLSEVLYKVMPVSFIGKSCKNKKVLNHKIYQFVKYNRFESYTRITLLDGFRISDIEWMKFRSTHENARSFQNENEFVWWRLLKWLLEDYLISLMRCFFYVTEK